MTANALTREEVFALWGFSEIFSPRFAEGYMGWGITSEFIAKSKNAAFENLTPAEKSELVRVVSRYRRPIIEGATKNYLPPATKFHFMEITTDRLHAIPLMNSFYRKTPATLGEYIANDPPDNFNQSYRDVIGAAEEILKTNRPYNGFPMIAYDPRLRKDVLIDGYARVISRIFKYDKDKIIEPVRFIKCAP